MGKSRCPPVSGCPPVSAHGLGTLMRTWALRMSRRHSRTRTIALVGGRRGPEQLVRVYSRLGSFLLPGIGARASLCGTSFLGPLRGGRGRGEEDQVDSLLRSSSTPAVAYAGWFGWFFSPFVPYCVYRPEMAPHHGRYAPEGQLLEVYRKIGLSGR